MCEQDDEGSDPDRDRRPVSMPPSPSPAFPGPTQNGDSGRVEILAAGIVRLRDRAAGGGGGKSTSGGTRASLQDLGGPGDKGGKGGDEGGVGCAPCPAAVPRGKREKPNERRRRVKREKRAAEAAEWARRETAEGGREGDGAGPWQSPASVAEGKGEGRAAAGCSGDAPGDNEGEKNGQKNGKKRKKGWGDGGRAPQAPPATASVEPSSPPTDPSPLDLSSGGLFGFRLGPVGGASHVAVGESGPLAKARERLSGARFRSLNEQLYTTRGSDAFDLMSRDPTLFDAYHEGFRRQASGWRHNPVDAAVARARKLPGGSAVGDFGCGDAALHDALVERPGIASAGTSMSDKKGALAVVRSFDLVSRRPGIVDACCLSNVPCPTASAELAVFSLALMGIDYGSFLVEARRCLKPGGRLWIAEVRSRFAAGAGREKDGVRAFVRAMRRAGFAPAGDAAGSERAFERGGDNTMFLMLEFQRDEVVEGEGDEGKEKRDDIDWPALQACEYKRR